MKVIDLLNKIANGERPKIIKVKLPNWNYEYEYDEEKDDWYNYEKVQWFDEINLLFCLNDEVEIIEEDKKIEEKCITLLNKAKFYDNRFPDSWEEEMISKIDEIVKAVNKLILKGKSE